MVANVLSIAGTDPTGGAGIHADLKTFAALGAYGMAVITAVVAQNTSEVRSFTALEPSLVADQIDAVFDDVRVDAVKIGMVANAPIAETIAERLLYHGALNVVLDPVMVAKSGDPLLDRDTVSALRRTLAPISTVMTPNLPEAAVLLDDAVARSRADMDEQVGRLRELGCDWALLKGGHLVGTPDSVDLLAGPGGTEFFTAPRLVTRNDHGTGCTLSAAVAAVLPGASVVESVATAKTYLQGALGASDALDVGRGRGPLHHFWNHDRGRNAGGPYSADAR